MSNKDPIKVKIIFSIYDKFQVIDSSFKAKWITKTQH